MTHLLDTSTLHKYGRYPAVQQSVDFLSTQGALFTTCAPIVAEYCFSAPNAEVLRDMQSLCQRFSEVAEFDPTVVNHIQSALWNTGRMRAAGAIDTLIAVYALCSNQTVVTCDSGFIHIARALQASTSEFQLRVNFITEAGEVRST